MSIDKFLPSKLPDEKQKRDNDNAVADMPKSDPSLWLKNQDHQIGINDDKLRQEYLSMSAGQQFEQFTYKDRQQNLRVSQRFGGGVAIRNDVVGSNGTIQIADDAPASQKHIGGKYNDGCIWIFKDRMRFIIIIMGLVAIVLNQMSRVVFNITIPLMTYPVNSSCHPPSIDACPSHDLILTLCNANTTSLINENDHNAHDDGILRFNWTPAEQDQLLGAFFYTYSGLQIPFGVLAEKYGAKYLILASVSISGLCSLLTPLIARQSAGLTMLFWSRLLVGASQAAIFPAMYALINQWITVTESLVIASLIKMAFRLGALTGSIVPGLVYGWEAGYYITGGICMLWTLLWLLLATSKPQDNSCVSWQELYRIARKKNDKNQILASVESNQIDKLQLRPRFESNEQLDSEQAANDISASGAKKPELNLRVWWIILTSRSVIGFVLCKLTVNFTTDFLTGIMPTYVRDLYHGDKSKISIVNSLTATVQVLVSFPISWLIKYTNKSRPFGLKATGLRRVFAAITCFGAAFFLVTLTLVKCDLVYASIMLQLVAITNMFSGGSESLVPYDLSENYPATIAAIGNSFSSMSGFVIPILKTAIISDSTDSVSAWNYYILAIALLQTIGGFIFIFNVKAKKLDFTVRDDDNTSSSNVEPDIQMNRAKEKPVMRISMISKDSSFDAKQEEISKVSVSQEFADNSK